MDSSAKPTREIPGIALLSIRRGTVRTVSPEGSGQWWDKTWSSGFFKESVEESVALGREGLDGDAQADRKHHGGPDKAVCAYPAVHFDYWRREIGQPELGAGAFGENFTLGSVAEDEVCIGDIIEAGSALLQISQPRQPCWKLARRWRVKDLPLRVERTGFTGWYFRVIEEGKVTPGATLHLRERPHPEWTVSDANEVMHDRKGGDPAAVAALAACPALSASWRETLAKRAERAGSSQHHDEDTVAARRRGPN